MPPRPTPNRKTPRITDGILTDVDLNIVVGSTSWMDWLTKASRFSLSTVAHGNVLFRKEQRQRGGSYWSAYRRVAGRTYHIYVGKDPELSLVTLETTAERLTELIAGGGRTIAIGKRQIDPPRINAVRFDDITIWFDLVDGRVLGVPLDWFPKLLQADNIQRANWQLIAHATGVAWDTLDEHLSIRVLMNLPS